nr:hypothetical protein [Chlorobium sp. KB01]
MIEYEMLRLDEDFSYGFELAAKLSGFAAVEIRPEITEQGVFDEKIEFKHQFFPVEAEPEWQPTGIAGYGLNSGKRIDHLPVYLRGEALSVHGDEVLQLHRSAVLDQQKALSGIDGNDFRNRQVIAAQEVVHNQERVVVRVRFAKQGVAAGDCAAFRTRDPVIAPGGGIALYRGDMKLISIFRAVKAPYMVLGIHSGAYKNVLCRQGSAKTGYLNRRTLQQDKKKAPYPLRYKVLQKRKGAYFFGARAEETLCST